MTHDSMPVGSTSGGECRIGGRYLNTKNRQPLTLRYIGPLPPATSASTSSSSSTPQWLGVEYDDPAHGKGHSGTYEGQQVFKSVQDGAGAFIRARKGDELESGPTLIQAIKERYDLDVDLAASNNSNRREGRGGVVLGGSGSAIIVEAPGMEEVQKRLKNLDRLRQMGLEGRYISAVGGDKDERAGFRQRLKGVELLDISRNLLRTWVDVAKIVDLLPGLKILIVNDSRFSRLEDQHDLDRCAPLGQLKELHLARSLIDWETISRLGPLLSVLDELHLPGNLSIGTSNLDRPLPGFDSLKLLNLETCGLMRWSTLETGLSSLSDLETLNISGNPLAVDANSSDDADVGSKLHSLRNLIMLNTPIIRISDLATLSSRIPELRTLRYSIDPGVPLDATPEGGGSRLTGNVSEDRAVLVAVFPKLTMLNGTDVRPKERDEAERRYLQLMGKSSTPTVQGEEWRIYDHLAKKHGQSSRKTAKPIIIEAQPHTLRSKLITLHVYANDGSSFTMPILPSAPIPLLRRKIAKKISEDPEDVLLYTIRRTQTAVELQADDQEVWMNEKVAKVEDGEVGYWFDDGDGVMAE